MCFKFFFFFKLFNNYIDITIQLFSVEYCNLIFIFGEIRNIEESSKFNHPCRVGTCIVQLSFIFSSPLQQ